MEEAMRKHALITGGNSGIGYAVAKLLKNKDYEVVISGRNTERVNQAAKELGASALVADISSINDIRTLASQFMESGLDVLVNNAGKAEPGPIGSYDENRFTDHINTNVRGPLFLIQELLPALEKNQGSITNISSIITHHGAPNLGIYAASKGAIEALTRTLALELAPKNIRINAVAPGAIDTPIITKMGLTEEQQKIIIEHHQTTTPLGRLGSPDEVAQVVVAQLESTYVTGSIWTVDGGVDA